MPGKMETRNNFDRTYMPVFPQERERLQLRLPASSSWRTRLLAWVLGGPGRHHLGRVPGLPYAQPALGASGEAWPPAGDPATLAPTLHASPAGTPVPINFSFGTSSTRNLHVLRADAERLDGRSHGRPRGRARAGARITGRTPSLPGRDPDVSQSPHSASQQLGKRPARHFCVS